MLFSSMQYKAMLSSEHDGISEEKFSDVPYNIHISNLGSSHGACAFDYYDYKDKINTFNFALTAQSLSYDYLILKQYEDHFVDGGIMFIVISYFTFGINEEDEADFRSKNERYYSFLEPENIKQFDWKQYYKIKYFPLFFSDIKKVLTNIEMALTNKEIRKAVPDFDYQKDADAAYKRHIHISDNGDLLVNEKEIMALYGIIDICKKHNIKPILVTTPYRREYNNEFNDNFYKQFHNIINDICKNTSVEYRDYSHDYRFIDSDEYNYNADHLSSTGAIYFTDIVINELVENNLGSIK